MSARSTIYATFFQLIAYILMFWNKEGCTSIFSRQNRVVFYCWDIDVTSSSQALSCSVSGILAWLTTSLLSLKQRLCNTSLFTGLGQLYPEMSLLHTFVQFACCSCYLYHFKTIWQQNSKAVMQKQNSKAIMQKATNSTDSKMQRNPKRKRNIFLQE